MKPIHPKKILLFGAGRIVRSFIAQLFYQAGNKLVFVDIDFRCKECKREDDRD